MIVTTNNKHYSDIAGAIREKLGAEDTYKPEEMAEAVLSIDGGVEPETPQDGKTRLYIDVPDRYRMDVPLYFSQTVTDGVLIDKGDGSEPFTLSGTGNRNTTLSYAEPGKYCITLEVLNGRISLGGGASYAVIGGSDQDYRNMLYKAEVGNNMTSIGNHAFRDCRSLQSVNIPDGVTNIGSGAFRDCRSLQSVTIPDSVTSIEGDAFHDCYTLQSITIPTGVTSIGNYAFYDCRSIQSVNIPDSVTSIAFQAFYNCTSMQEYIFMPTTPPTINPTAFTGIPADCQIFVPDDSLEAYKTATNWSTYADKIYPISERVIKIEI